MYCKKCGNFLDDDAKFCTKCGEAVEFEVNEETKEEAKEEIKEPIDFTHHSFEETPAEKERKRSLASSALTFGILGISFTCTVFLSLLGIIFSGIAIGKSNTYLRTYAERSGKVVAGRILGRFGLGFGIAFAAYITFITFIIIVGISAGGAY